jgi:hypothetical protein
MSFEFKIKTGVDMSAWGPATRAGGHDFPWDKLKPGQSIDIPKAYWIDRGMEEKDYDPKKLRERVRMHFRGWQEKDPARKSIMLRLREVKDEKAGNYLEAGFDKVTATAPAKSKPAKGKGKAASAKSATKRSATPAQHAEEPAAAA